MRNNRPLSGNRKRFVAELFNMTPQNATAAYLRVWPDVKRESAGAAAARLMAEPEVRAEVEKWEKQILGKLSLKAEEVINEVCSIATADSRELTEYYVGACRYCHGADYRYQRTPAEFERDLKTYLATREKMKKPDPLGIEFDHLGGVGFNPKKSPHEDCPECFGHGVGYEHIKDTRDLSPQAARLYAGVKRTKDGIQILTRSQDKMIELAGQNMGLFKQQVELGGPGGGPIQSSTVNISATTTDPIEASKLYAAITSGRVK